MEVRPVRPEEYEEAGKLVVAAYEALPGDHVLGDYATELADVARRASEADVLVAAMSSAGRGADEIVGCVTFVPDSTSPWSEFLEAGESGIRMLAIHPDAQGRGVGRTLVHACIARARELGRTSLMLHTTPWMTAAHRLYEDVGFERFPQRDWTPDPEVPLLAYRLEIGDSSRAR